MARVGWRAVAKRFVHIDAAFRGCRFSFDEESFLRVRFYPCWEHPRYVAARAAGEPWGFSWDDDAARDVTVYPIDLVSFAFSRRTEIAEWEFVDHGPPLWPFEDPGTVYVNQPIDPDPIVDDVARRLGVADTALAELRATLTQWRTRPSFSVTQPRSVAAALIDSLAALGIDHFVHHCPAAGAPLVALVLDSFETIVARDFEVDVPEFEHRDEWFTA